MPSDSFSHLLHLLAFTRILHSDFFEYDLNIEHSCVAKVFSFYLFSKFHSKTTSSRTKLFPLIFLHFKILIVKKIIDFILCM